MGDQEVNYGVLDTPEVEAPKRRSDAHQAEITSVTLRRTESGATAIDINLHSHNEGFDDTFNVWLPKTFVANFAKFMSGEMSPNDLPTGEFDPELGRVVGNEKAAYGRSIRCSDKSAALQNALIIAAAQGKTVNGESKPTAIEEYTEVYNQVLSGTQVVFIRRADSKPSDPQFANRLRVRGILDPSVASNPKKLKNYRRAWLQE